MKKSRLPAVRGSSLPARAPAPAPAALAGFLSENTKRAYGKDLEQFFGVDDLPSLPLERVLGVTYQDIVAFRDRLLAEKKRPSTVSRKLSAIRMLYKHLIATGATTSNPADPQLVRSPKRSAVVLTDALDKAQTRRLLEQPDVSKPLGQRDLAMLLLAVKSGLRRSELCGLRDDCFEHRNGRTVVTFQGKGEKTRNVPVPADVWEAIKAWIRARPPKAEWTFVTSRGDRMTEHAFWKLVRRYAERAGLKGNDVRPHTLRATCATLLLESGVPIHQVQVILGHSRGETTLGYARRTAIWESKAFDALDDVGPE